MLGIYHKVITHKFNVDSEYKPVKQKKKLPPKETRSLIKRYKD